ncbi:pseudouridine synthase [Auricularia subglabra TFB-10046 SS5]|nr:pseudouridine synthase [Auricularia subglabra TFB-10046 SS5]
MALRALPQASRRHAVQILYEDRGVMVVNKPPGFDSQLRSSLNRPKDGVRHWIEELADRAPNGLRTVHRLDKNTTGALVLLKNVQLTRELARQFTKREVNKVYLAIVRGHLWTSGNGEWLGGQLRTEVDIADGRVSVRADSDDPKRAFSDWELVATSTVFPDLSLVRLRLVTGFKHQLRVQLANELGTPVLGDHLYDPKVKVAHEAESALPGRLFLHASHLAFYRYRRAGHRIRLGVTAPVPDYFSALCDEAGLPLTRQQRQGALFLDHEQCNVRPGDRITDWDGMWMPGPDDLPTAWRIVKNSLF